VGLVVGRVVGLVVGRLVGGAAIAGTAHRQTIIASFSMTEVLPQHRVRPE